ncbi:MAG TPA: hypothetical protein VMG80_01190, partial [Solirubrobacteraceae bacterium]|nr:hypothetical protein [Solirubrobacteraceae bacterium]
RKMPHMGGPPRIWFVHERFEQLRALLERWGWEVVERGDLSRWNEQGRHDPVLGLVSVRGRRAWPLGGEVTFTIKEWWGRPPLEGPERRQGLVLAGYHYTAQSIDRQVRHCYDAVRHPEAPYHVHPRGDQKIRPEPAITAESALSLFEQRLAEELHKLSDD